MRNLAAIAFAIMAPKAKRDAWTDSSCSQSGGRPCFSKTLFMTCGIGLALVFGRVAAYTTTTRVPTDAKSQKNFASARRVPAQPWLERMRPKYQSSRQ